MMPIVDSRITEATMLVRARRCVLDSGDWITAACIAEGSSRFGGDAGAILCGWKRAGAIFSIQHDGIDYYPLYGLDTVEWRPSAELGPVLNVLRPHRDDWGIAFWFESLNAALDNTPPKAVLKDRSRDVLRAAHREIGEQLHPHG